MAPESSYEQMADEGQLELKHYLQSQYAGIFSDAQIESHIRDYVGAGFANWVAPYVINRLPPGGKVLDIGTGFGSFVIVCRQMGLDAIGIDIAEFEIKYARDCLQKERPQDDPLSVFRLVDGLDLPFPSNSFDALTLWNVLEHVRDSKRLLTETTRVLKPGGILYIICPNYAAFRDEAHYHVFWPPLLPRKFAAIYLKLHGKNPHFFQTSIFYRTNWEIQRHLKRLSMQLSYLDGPPSFDFSEVELIERNIKRKIVQPELVKNPKIKSLLTGLKRLHLSWLPNIGIKIVIFQQYFKICWRRILYYIGLYNPFVQSVVLSAKKRLSDV